MDGLVERLNQTSKVIFTEKKCHDLNALLGLVTMVYRTTPVVSIEKSTFYLLYEHDAKLPTAMGLR